MNRMLRSVAIIGILIAVPFLSLGDVALAQNQNAHLFKNNLTVGSTGADVTALQQILIDKGFLTSVVVPTGYFGPGTKTALKKFQAANAISPASGYGGPLTRAFLNTVSAKLPLHQSTLSLSNPGQVLGASTSIASTSVTVPRGPSSPITNPLVNQQALKDATVAVICVGPAVVTSSITTSGYGFINVGIQFYTLGSGVVINPNGYVLTNAHVIHDSRQCFLGRQYIDASGDFHTVVAAVYNFLSVVGTGNWQSIENVTDPTPEQYAASRRDFAVLKIGDRFTPSLWDQNGYQLSSLNIPVASDADYAKYSTGGKFPAIGVNFSYQPVIGDLLFLDGYIGDTARSRFTFSQGKVNTITSDNIGAEMPTGQGLSGSPIVDSSGNLVGLNYLLNCSTIGGGACHTTQPNDVSPNGFTSGNYNLALSVPFLNQTMKEDLGFDLKDLMSKP